MIVALLLLLALLGHAFVWIGLVNRLQPPGIRRRIIKILTLGLIAGSLSHFDRRRPAVDRDPVRPWDWRDGRPRPMAAPADGSSAGDVVACWIILAVTLVRLIWLRAFCRRPSVVRFHGRQLGGNRPAAAAKNAGETGPIIRSPGCR